MKQFDKVYARFNPRDLTTLRRGARPFVGLCTTWEAYWIIEEGPYSGQWAMVARGWWDSGFPGWVPEIDLSIVPQPTTQKTPLIELLEKDDGNWLRFVSPTGKEALWNLGFFGSSNIVFLAIQETIAALRFHAEKMEARLEEYLGIKTCLDIRGITLSLKDVRISDLQAALSLAQKELEEKERDLDQRIRKALWLAHGSPLHYLYGDDGKMDCNACLLDFVNDPWEKILDKLDDNALRRAGGDKRI